MSTGSAIGGALELSLQFGRLADAAEHRKILTAANVRRWIGFALDEPAQIAVRVVGEEEGRTLNRQFRGKDYATNVLTFFYGDDPQLSADIVLCAAVVKREAADQGKALKDHYAHLLVHGALHAQGWDHESGERGALEMEALEILLLGALGIANPY